MAKLKVTRADGQVQEFEITPLLEYSFEQYAKKGFHKATGSRTFRIRALLRDLSEFKKNRNPIEQVVPDNTLE